MRPSARTEAHSATYGSAFTELSRNCLALRFLEGHHLQRIQPHISDLHQSKSTQILPERSLSYTLCESPCNELTRICSSVARMSP